MRKKLKRLIWIAPAAIVGMAVFTAIGGGVVMLLWNWLAPMLFGLRLITFWQALGLLALCRILFGGFGLGGGGSHRSRSRRRMRERWGTDDSRGARTIPARRTRTLGLWTTPQREQGAMKPSERSLTLWLLVIGANAQVSINKRGGTSAIQYHWRQTVNLDGRVCNADHVIPCAGMRFQ